MLITDIKEVSKTKSKVFVDYETAFVLYKSEIRKYNIKAGEELTEETYHIILDEVLPKRAKLRSMNLLKDRDYTRYQLEAKLRQNGYPEETIAIAVNYVKAYGYIDDVRYAKAYMGCTGSTKSRKQIENDLLRKGVSKEDILKAYELCADENILTDEDDLIKKLLAKRHYDSQAATSEERRKIIGFLYRKGFSLDKIYKAVGQTD